MKKGQGLSLNVIIIAVLAITVLVILLWVSVNRFQIFGKGLSEETSAEVCQAPNKIASVTACDTPLVGEYVRQDKSKLRFNEVCCAP